MSIFPRPLKQVLGKIIPFSLVDLIPTFNLGTGTADSTTFLRGDQTWAPISSGSSSIPNGIASGTDTYSVTITGVSSYIDGDAFLVRFTNGNTTVCTLNINTLGAKALYKNNDGPLIGGDIISSGEMLCVYNSTLDAFQVIGTSPNVLLSYVTNSEAITITKGQPVYAFGGTGDRLRVKLAYNTSDATSAQTVGIVVSTSIGSNQKGLIIVNGLLDNLNTLPTSTFADGDAIYLGATAGTITNVKPSAPNHLVYLGFVTTASPGSAGRMYVRIQNGYEMDEIHDVQVGSYGTNDILWRDTSTNLWKNKDIFTLMGASSSSTNGYLTSTNWNTFNGKQDIITLTTTGTGAATLISNTLNIPTPSSGGGLTIGTTAITSGTIGRILFEGASNKVQEDSALFWDNTNKRLGVGTTPSTSVRLDVRAQGALSTDIGFRVRNSADTYNVLTTNGTDCVWSNGKGGESGTTAFGELTLTTRSSGSSNTVFGYQSGNILTTGSNNTMLGYRAGGGVLASSFTGSNNTLVGSAAGLYLSSGIQNTFIGGSAGTSVTTGSYNTIIGFNGNSYASGLASHIIITDGASVQGFKKDGNHNVVLSQESALATNATNGFIYCRGGAGVPTGVPATAFTGHVPMYVDTTNSKMYIYSGGTWVALN